MKLRVPLSLLVLLAAANVCAQTLPARYASKDWIVDRWGSDQGLPQNTVMGIAQTKDGYLWLATYGGLVRFDGVRFTAFTTREYPGLGSDRVSHVRLAPDGSLWLGTDRGLVHYANGRFQEWTEADGRPRGTMNSLFIDSTGAAWMTSEVGGIARFANGRFQHFAGVDTGWTGGIVVDGRGNVWLEGSNSLWEKPAGAAQFARVVFPAPGLHPHGPILVDREGDVWFNGDREAMTLHDGALVPAPIGAQVLTQDASGGIWAAIRGGIWHRDSLGQTTLIPVTDDAGSRQIKALLVDREGTVWAGTSTNGLLRMRPRVFRMIMKEDGLASEQVAAIMRDRKGRLWVGASCDATTIIASDTRTVTGDPGCVFSLAQAADGSIWAGSYGGLTRVRADGAREKIPLDSLPNTTALALYADADTTLWIGTQNGLVHVVHGQYRKYAKGDGLPSTEIHYITRDRQGVLWIGTVGGLARLDGDHFHAWTTADGLPHNYVRAIYQDADSVWWIGTYGGGLARFDGKRFVSVTTANGLFDNVVSSILEDARGNLWMSGNRGIFRASRTSLNDFANGTAPTVTSVGYGPSDGLLTVETNGGFEPSAWQDKDGRLWFATVRGLATVDPNAAVPTPTAPGVSIESAAADGAPLATDSTIHLAVGTRYLEIRYTGLTSIAPELLNFRYKLDGLDTGWVYVGPRRVAYFSNLAPRTYRFTVSAATRDGRWNEAGQSLAIVLPAAWYATLWFRALVVLLVLAVAALAVWRRIEALHEQQRIQREYARQLLQGQETERRRLAGELHDSVGQDLLVMKNRAAMALQSSDVTPAVRAHIQEISDVATLAVQNAREISHGLRPYQLDRLGLVAALRDLAERASASSGVAVDVNAEGVDGALTADAATQVYRIAQEGLNNILKHANATHATIAIEQRDGVVLLRITDDGRGMDLSRGPGFGLTGIEQRVQILSGTFNVSSTVGRGSALEISIPRSAP